MQRHPQDDPQHPSLIRATDTRPDQQLSAYRRLLLAALVGLLLFSACGSSGVSEDRQRELEDRIRELEAAREEDESVSDTDLDIDDDASDEADAPNDADASAADGKREAGNGAARQEDTDAMDSAVRRRYLLESGGVAPPGATVTFDIGPTEDGFDQGFRTTADRWPHGFPAAPRSLDYTETTLAEREKHRAARWVTVMDRSGVDEYWVYLVPPLATIPYTFEETFGPETSKMAQLRDYAISVLADGRPAADLIWAHPRWLICGRSEEWKLLPGNQDVGIDLLGCEPTLDWVLWAVEELAHELSGPRSIAEAVGTVAREKLAIKLNALDTLPRTYQRAMGAMIGESQNLWAPIFLISSLYLRNWNILEAPENDTSIDETAEAAFGALITVALELESGTYQG